MSSNPSCVSRMQYSGFGPSKNPAGIHFGKKHGPARAIRCASAIAAYASRLDVETCTGLHTGECEIVDSQVSGAAAQMCVWVENEAEPVEVLVSSTVKDLVAGSGIEFEDRGIHLLSGCGDCRLFMVQR